MGGREGRCQTQREEKSSGEEDPSVFSGLAIHFHYASPTASLYHSALAVLLLIGLWATAITLQAWQHIVDVPLLKDVVAFLSDACLVDTERHNENGSTAKRPHSFITRWIYFREKQQSPSVFLFLSNNTFTCTKNTHNPTANTSALSKFAAPPTPNKPPHPCKWGGLIRAGTRSKHSQGWMKRRGICLNTHPPNADGPIRRILIIASGNLWAAPLAASRELSK